MIKVTKKGKITRMASGAKEYGKIVVILPELAKKTGQEIEYTFITEDC